LGVTLKGNGNPDGVVFQSVTGDATLSGLVEFIWRNRGRCKRQPRAEGLNAVGVLLLFGFRLGLEFRSFATQVFGPGLAVGFFLAGGEVFHGLDRVGMSGRAMLASEFQLRDPAGDDLFTGPSEWKHKKQIQFYREFNSPGN
jgi:hypothetical protein